MPVNTDAIEPKNLIRLKTSIKVKAGSVPTQTRPVNPYRTPPRVVDQGYDEAHERAQSRFDGAPWKNEF